VPHATLSPGDHAETLMVGSLPRTLILHVPPGPAVRNRPLILVYTAATASATETENSTDFAQVADRTGEIVAFMQGYQNSWNEGTGVTPARQAHVDDVAYTAASIAMIEGLVAFDHRRIAAVGFSNGALMVEYLGCQLAGQLAVIVPVEGELPTVISQGCDPTRAVSVYEIHGTADSEIPYGGGSFRGSWGGIVTVLSAPASVARWAQLDGCDMTPTTTSPSSSISLTTYASCQGATTAVLRTIIDGGHVWGSNIGELVAAAMPSASGKGAKPPLTSRGRPCGVSSLAGGALRHPSCVDRGATCDARVIGPRPCPFTQGQRGTVLRSRLDERGRDARVHRPIQALV